MSKPKLIEDQAGGKLPTCLIRIINGKWAGPGIYGNNQFGLEFVASANNLKGWQHIETSPYYHGFKIRKTEKFKEG